MTDPCPFCDTITEYLDYLNVSEGIRWCDTCKNSWKEQCLTQPKPSC